jgi:hypothetical protein
MRTPAQKEPVMPQTSVYPEDPGTIPGLEILVRSPPSVLTVYKPLFAPGGPSTLKTSFSPSDDQSNHR